MKKILEAHGEDPVTTIQCGVYYRLGFTHRFRYEADESEYVDPIDLASKQWYNNVKTGLDDHDEDPVVTAKCGVHYRLAFIHGIKHRKEAKVYS